ncbi:MAG TPA: ATP-dependent DNA helicase RecG, partial [Gammaproteobacteria bacterium]|nr:ATP-dependent DNA helicase RecG [Gammaproteobacteria bacterium]
MVCAIRTNLEQYPLLELRGVGPKLNEQLARLGLSSVLDLLFHLPRDYQDRTRLHTLKSLRLGQHVLIQATVFDSRLHYGRRRAWLVQLSDGTGRLTLRFFHFSNVQQKAIQKGQLLRCFGEVRHGPNGYEMVHPEYEQVDEGTPIQSDTLTPVYPTTEGIRQASLRQLTDQALSLLTNTEDAALPDYIPAECLPAQISYSLTAALRILHRPSGRELESLNQLDQHPALKRLAFEELVAHQLSMLEVKNKRKEKLAPTIARLEINQCQVLKQLDFDLTAAQTRVSHEILLDLICRHPMHRLVQGDVGSGKTVVAALAAEITIRSAYQVALMVPTEILAEQHFENFHRWFDPLGYRVCLLTGKLSNRMRQSLICDIQAGDIQVVVGTHALFQNDVIFHKLGLVVFDEQHRFGVRQRYALTNKGGDNQDEPHQLVMTATPIPRTLAMVNYADLDLSIIDELPPGRQPIDTMVLSNSRRDEVITRLKHVCASGGQVYWVCTLIEESELMQAQAAQQAYQSLQEQLPELRIGLIHGRMKIGERQQIMQQFKVGDIDILVATTVIEVGVDVPNANTMIIDNAERLGLSQLHQLRGRV